MPSYSNKIQQKSFRLKMPRMVFIRRKLKHPVPSAGTTRISLVVCEKCERYPTGRLTFSRLKGDELSVNEDRPAVALRNTM